MKLSQVITESAYDFSIQYWDEMAEEYDPWVTASQAEAIADSSGIRISRNKELTFIAMRDGDVIGAVWSDIVQNDDDFDDTSYDYDFDIAVDKESRGMVGLKLIESAISDYYDKLSDQQNSRIKVWVINPKLVRVLENKYHFDIESEYSDGSAYMVYYG